VVLKFIQSKEGVHELHAPKGMAIVDRRLYVSDVDTVRAYDLSTGEPVEVISLAHYEPRFLNDVTADSRGHLYVSDMDGDVIYKIDTRNDHKVSVFRSGDALGKPNGLYFNHHNRHLLVATWGSGEILEIDEKGRIQVLKKGFKNLDGIFMDRNGNLFVSSFTQGEIYKISEGGRGTVRLFRSGLQSPADIAYDSIHQDVLAPFMNENRVSSFDISGLEKPKD